MRTERNWPANALTALCAAVVSLPFALHIFEPAAAAVCAVATAATVFAIFTFADHAGA